MSSNFACRVKPSDHAEDDGIKTITYDEYVNAGIPDALLQGLGFAESLSEEPMEVEDPSDDDGKAAAEQREVLDDVSSADIQPGPSVVASTPIVPVSLVQVVGDMVLPIVSRNGSELPSSCSPVGSSYKNIISDTPSAVNFVDKDGKILPTLPPVPSLVGSTVPSTLIGDVGDGKVVPQAVTYVDLNGRVLARIPYPQTMSDPSAMVHMVDGNGRIITNQVQPNTAVLEKDSVVYGVNTSPGKAKISGTNVGSESDAGDFQSSLSASSVGHGRVGGSDVKQKELMTRRISSEDCNTSKSEYLNCPTEGRRLS